MLSVSKVSLSQAYSTLLIWLTFACYWRLLITFCKKFGARLGQTKTRPNKMSVLIWVQTLIIFLKEFFENVNFEEKNQQMTQKHAKLPSIQQSIPCDKNMQNYPACNNHFHVTKSMQNYLACNNYFHVTKSLQNYPVCNHHFHVTKNMHNLPACKERNIRVSTVSNHLKVSFFLSPLLNDNTLILHDLKEMPYIHMFIN